MTAATLAAAGAGAAGVWGTWEALGVLGDLAPARVLAPLRVAGREPTASERRRLAVLGALVLLAGGWLLAGPVLGALLAAGAPAGVGQLLAARRRRWRRALADGVPTVARALADALAGGHSVRGALQEVAGTIPGPAGAELQAAAHRLALGEPTEAVLEALRARAADPAWDVLVAAILLQQRAGGDLARLLRLVAAGRERARRDEAGARSATAQARATARLVAGLPLAGLALGELIAPGALAALLGDPRSRALVALAVVLGGAAVALVRKLGRVTPA